MRRKRKSMPVSILPPAAEIEAAVEQSGLWMTPTGHLQVIDRRTLFGPMHTPRYEVRAHEPACESPRRECECDVAAEQYRYLTDALTTLATAQERRMVAA